MYIEAMSYTTGEVPLDKQMNQIYMGKLGEFVSGIAPIGDKVALLYAAGPVMHHSDSRNIPGYSIDGSIVIKGQAGFNIYNVAKRIANVEYVSINGNSCASSMYSIHEAKKLIEDGFTDVVVYSDEVNTPSQKLLFEQVGANVICGSGAVIVHFTKEKTNKSLGCVYDTAWLWNKDSSPMSVSMDGYVKVIDKLDTEKVKLVKTHGTGTDRNTKEELDAVASRLADCKIVEYKPKIGHTQGASALIELGMLVDEHKNNNALCLASGMGGFYGGCCVSIYS